MRNRIYAAIDLKSFYASVECVERGLDPLTANLVVADASRTEKTICLAVSPSLKAYGIAGRARLFEVIAKIAEVNNLRQLKAPGRKLNGKSYLDTELKANPSLAVDYITAAPRMAHYIRHSTHIYNIYLKYVSPEDIHVYSIDEVFMDITDYLKTAGLSPRAFVARIIKDVYTDTGITATAGIGTNMYLAKIAMDIVAKHIDPGADGSRIAALDEMRYRRLLWTHRPLTDFWRIGRGYAKKLESLGLYTMGDIAKCSIGKPGDYYNDELLYKLFGVNAELLIDHAWGWESCTVSDIKSYKPETSSTGSGQVLQCPYPADKARIIVKEMIDNLVLELVAKGLITDRIVLSVGYDKENLSAGKNEYDGETIKDFFGRMVPKRAHGTANLGHFSSSTKEITKAVIKLYDEIVHPKLLIRRINITAANVVYETDAAMLPEFEQLDFFTDYTKLSRERDERKNERDREKSIQHTILDIKKKYGKNAVIKGMNLQEGATAISRNQQIGGHKA